MQHLAERNYKALIKDWIKRIKKEKIKEKKELEEIAL